MPQVHTDPERLREFAARLEAFREVLNDSTSRIQGQLSHLGDTWKDQEFDAFREKFLATSRVMKSFVDEVQRVSPLLRRDADAIEEYLRDRP